MPHLHPAASPTYRFVQRSAKKRSLISIFGLIIWIIHVISQCGNPVGSVDKAKKICQNVTFVWAFDFKLNTQYCLQHELEIQSWTSLFFLDVVLIRCFVKNIKWKMWILRSVIYVLISLNKRQKHYVLVVQNPETSWDKTLQTTFSLCRVRMMYTLLCILQLSSRGHAFITLAMQQLLFVRLLYCWFVVQRRRGEDNRSWELSVAEALNSSSS